ncbi:MED7 protein-domain-containing protein [Fimicolochytrium jonesii]|uniref:MED7 protein-domain-containing protein n=1 Tax=Fimicolochytrium jonesii TaxID=1396493 RepID=UPI0022FE5795|nr:MED7 protein-domain-containing protein [Fimicolochytrium jonesii]KAI8818916.1 MED7 protein-domain-containing protein [Fimicolochytrium jonesii]
MEGAQPPPPDTTQFTTAYPLPPAYFNNYTDPAVAPFPRYQRTQTDSTTTTTTKKNDTVTTPKDPVGSPIYSFDVGIHAEATEANERAAKEEEEGKTTRLFLHPPKPIVGPYSVFGATHDIDVKRKSLKELGIEQLYPDGPIDFKAVLKHLIRALQLNLLEYLDVVTERTEQFEYKKEQIWLILQNIHHVINEYRPHQARDILRLMLERQIAKKQATAEKLRGFCKAAREEFESERRALLDAQPPHEEDGMRKAAVSDPKVLRALQKYRVAQQRLLGMVDV